MDKDGLLGYTVAELNQRTDTCLARAAHSTGQALLPETIQSGDLWPMCAIRAEYYDQEILAGQSEPDVMTWQTEFTHRVLTPFGLKARPAKIGSVEDLSTRIGPDEEVIVGLAPTEKEKKAGKVPHAMHVKFVSGREPTSRVLGNDRKLTVQDVNLGLGETARRTYDTVNAWIVSPDYDQLPWAEEERDQWLAQREESHPGRFPTEHNPAPDHNNLSFQDLVEYLRG